MGFLTFEKFFRSAGEDKVSSTVSRLRAKIYDPVRSTYDIRIMLHNYYGMAFCKKRIERPEKLFHIIEMQSGSRFIKDEEYPLSFCLGTGIVHRQEIGQFNTLALTSGQCTAALTELYI